MSTKLFWILTVSAALGLGALGGAALQEARDAESAGDATGPVASADTLTAAGTAGPTLAPDAASATATLESEVRDLREKLAAAETENEALAERLAAAGEATEGVSAGPVFTFGEVGKLDAVREADWSEMAKSSSVVSDSIRAIRDHAARGEKAPKSVYLALQENVERMRKYEYRTIGKVETDAKHNGELTHPVTLANLVAAMLADAGEPLSGAQVERITALGDAFERDAESLRRRHADAPRVRRLLEEMRLKARFSDDMKAVLDTAQREAIYRPETEDVAGLDLLSATLMMVHTSPVVAGPDRSVIAGKLAGILKQKLGIDDTQLDALQAAVLGFVDRTAPLHAAAVPPASAKHYPLSDGLAAGEATVALVERLLRDLDLEKGVRKALQEDPAIYVPRRVE